MRSFLTILAAGLLLTSSAAQAAPVPTNVVVDIRLEGLGQISFSGAASVSVSGSTVSIGAGAVSLLEPIFIPVTSTTAINSITARTVSNAAGTFSIGGVTAQAPGEVCPNGGPPPGSACNAGGGIGGIMGLGGFINVRFFADLTAPLDLNAALLGQGGSTSAPFVIDAAVYSTGVGSLAVGTQLVTSIGSSSALRLVSPTFISVIGIPTPTFTSITFTNVSLPVPEPAGMILVGLGVAAILGVAARRP